MIEDNISFYNRSEELDLRTNISATLDTRLSPFVAFQHRDFRLLWIGQFVSEFGTHMQQVTINWHIYLLTRSAFALGLAGLVRFAPVVVFSLFGGVIADAYDRRRVMLVTQSAMMLFAATLGLLTYSGWISVGLIYVLVALTGAASVFDAPARQALPPNLVPLEHLTNALSLNNINSQTTKIVGPALAGFVIAWEGVAAVYWINAASFLTVLMALILMRTPTQQKLGAADITLKALGDGIRFVRHSQILFSTMLLDFFSTFFSAFSTLLPIFANEILRVGPQGFGILSSSQAMGAVIAGGGIAFAGNVGNKGILVLLALTLYGTATAFFGISHWFSLSLLLLAVVGGADALSGILRNTLRQIITPDYLRGRMSSVNMIFSRGGQQLGNLEAGVVAALIGAPLSVIIGGIATVFTVAVVAWLVPQLRNYQG
jgi:MFS family permease